MMGVQKVELGGLGQLDINQSAASAVGELFAPIALAGLPQPKLRQETKLPAAAFVAEGGKSDGINYQCHAPTNPHSAPPLHSPFYTAPRDMRMQLCRVIRPYHFADLFLPPCTICKRDLTLDLSLALALKCSGVREG